MKMSILESSQETETFLTSVPSQSHESLKADLPTYHEKYSSPQSASVTSTTLIHILKWLFDTLRPSILTPSPRTRKQLSPTAYLDGLRGFAALLVYVQHHQVWARVGISANHIFENGYGYEGRYYFACLPVIRTFFTGGHFAVAVFFVISGRVLSAKPLALIHSQQYEKLSENLSSALFRRWLRLYLPCIITTFLYMTSWHLFGIWTAYPAHQRTYLDELWNWYAEFKQFSFVFRLTGEGSPPWFTYNFHLWSIPVEFKGSVLIYTVLLSLARCTRNARLSVLVGLIVYFLYIVDGPHFAMFLSGVLISDLEGLASTNSLPSFFYTHLQRYKNTIIYTALLASAYLSGVPSFSSFDITTLQSTPGWNILASLVPPSIKDYKLFFLFFASVLLVAVLPHNPLKLKSFFETRLCQYLGKISFPLYLVHGPILWTLADRVYLAVGWGRDENVDGLRDWIGWWDLGPGWMGRGGGLGMEAAFWIPQVLVLIPVTFWVAEVVGRVVDNGSVRWAGNLYAWVRGDR